MRILQLSSSETINCQKYSPSLLSVKTPRGSDENFTFGWGDRTLTLLVLPASYVQFRRFLVPRKAEPIIQPEIEQEARA
jgi:hypothetical protein